MLKQIMSSVAVLIFMVMSPITIFAERLLEVETSEINQGIVKVIYENEDVSKAKFMIQKDSQKYYYNLKNNGKEEEFSLQMGSGDYDIAVYENLYSTKYRRVYIETVTVSLEEEEETSVYTKSIQNIKFNNNSTSTKIAKRLVKNADSDEEKAKIIYQYIVNNISYDYNKIKTLSSNYVPNPDQTLIDESGICYDYASLYAAMLRSQDIPTKLIKGYSTTTKAYHAWNEVYLNDEWVIVDTTYDAFQESHNRDYTFEKSSKNYATEKEY